MEGEEQQGCRERVRLPWSLGELFRSLQLSLLQMLQTRPPPDLRGPALSVAGLPGLTRC